MEHASIRVRYYSYGFIWTHSNYCPSLNTNLAEARKCWGRFGGGLGREGADVITSDLLYCTLVQVILLYG